MTDFYHVALVNGKAERLGDAPCHRLNADAAERFPQK